MARSRRVVNALSVAMTTALLTGSAAMTSALLTGSAAAQAPSLNMPMGGETKTLTDEEKEKQAERERAYKDAIRKIPDQKANTDPWGNVRNSTESTSKQKKTGANTTGSSSK
jgi:hypothetical protein